MKTSILFKFVLLGLLLSSCSENNEPGSSETGADNEEVTSIVLSTTSNEVNTNSLVSFIVTSNTSTDLTSLSSLKLDGEAVSNPLLFNFEGTYEVVATFEDLTSNTVTITVTNVTPSSIELSFNQEFYNNGDFAIFTVTDNFNNTITNLAEFTLNGTDVISNPYQFTAYGTYNFEATYEGLTSNSVTINIETATEFSDISSFTNSGAPATFTKKALLEDFTGTWCPQCPPAGAAITNAINSNSNIFGVGYHAGNGDPMEIPETAYWSSYYKVTGFPTVYVNGPDTRWDYGSMSQVNSELAETATVGLAVDAAIVGGKLDLEVKVGFNETPVEEVKLMLYLVEDNVTVSIPQSGSSQGSNYVHKDVLRDVYTNQLGDVITASSTVASGVFTRTITGLDLPSNINDIANLKVIAFVRNTYTKTFVDYFNTTHTDAPHYDIYNVQEVHVGETKAFD
jgi:hypothetical protein